MCSGPVRAGLTLTLLGLCAAAPAPPQPSLPPPPCVVVVDPGHDSRRGGATSARGVAEVQFNDRAAAALVKALQARPGFEVHLSRGPTQRLTLSQRAARINRLAPDLVISLHHDSVQPQLLGDWTFEGRRLRYNDTIAGFSLFAPTRGSNARAAQLFAAELGDRLLAAGRQRSDYHAQKIPGEGRDWIDAQRGMYAGDFLFLLRRVEAPIVLVELGYIVNRDEEQDLAEPDRVEATAALMAGAVQAFWQRQHAERWQREPQR